MEKLAISTKAIILGRGVIEIEENNVIVDYRLSPASAARADAMVGYYKSHEQTFRDKGSIIVASGGYARLAGDQAPPPVNKREGMKIADALVRGGVPHRLIEPETDSGSTTENFQHTIGLGFFQQEEVFSAANPLLIVASGAHGKERGVPLARVSFGVEDWAGVGLLVAEAESFSNRIKERIGGLATSRAIAELQPQPFSVADMAAVGERFEDLIASPVAMAKISLRPGTSSGRLPMLNSRPAVMLAT